MNWLTELFCKKLAKKSQTSSNDLLVTELDTPLPEYKALPIDQLLETQPLAVLKKSSCRYAILTIFLSQI
ncbi:hypothetical protein [Methylocucumis oryzae]|uniref:Uncharacterized protein n=1 Tax=Methylocucumis oryzae TaxID=1632867 RepID=A0A0F3IEQ5_9GAMM|nr:hypothetical protein [Methylocucumis oryzae]KJV05147.1 hypothetical protein VZ94_20295 [Methylocucumis oryzae]